MYNCIHTPVQGMYIIQTRALAIADWLSQNSHEQNKDRDMRPKHKDQHDIYSSGPASVYINMRYTRSDSMRCTSARAKNIYHKGLATQKEDVAQDIQK